MNEATEALQIVGRLAFRVEGRWWVAYLAKAESMDGAEELARVLLGLVQDEPRKRQFVNLVRDIFADLVEEQSGVRPEFPLGPQAAPEHERSGNS